MKTHKYERVVLPDTNRDYVRTRDTTGLENTENVGPIDGKHR